MRHDHRPLWVKNVFGYVESAWVTYYLQPQLQSLGKHSMIMKPWYLKIHGDNISFGEAVHVITGRDRTVRLTTWKHEQGSGRIDIGSYALLCPGVRIDSASHVQIGANSMLAAGVYVTDADWHGLYNRAAPVGNTQKIVIESNTWIGDGSIICKGVSIGQNSIIGAGSVVTKSVPANVIAAGNPARVVKKLDPMQEIRTREALLADTDAMQRLQNLEKEIRQTNSLWQWIRSSIAPRSDD